ncbi:hypothetical protein PIB30_022582 [Stylosanthes scabra]|uniref:Retrotransposon gag domain-containing protein n=1 Tax=Stylosanthes scabra TaxID=79078 RepID=A0ABU6Z6P0_9FABA|nr:hypothetical protein [Stylosanthes scabra]
MLSSNSDPDLLLFDPEVERTLRRVQWFTGGRPKHLKVFDVIYATPRSTSGKEDAVKAFALPFSLEGKAKDWYHTLPNEVTIDWALFRKKVPRKIFSTFKNQCNSKGDFRYYTSSWENLA